MSKAQRIHDFFEKPSCIWAYLVQGLIFLLIFISVGMVYIEMAQVELYQRYAGWFQYGEYIVLAVFTIEYLLRILSAPQKLKFAIKPLNIIDLLAIVPTYLEFFIGIAFNTSGIRIIRVIRLLRLSRGLRIFKIFKYGMFFCQVFRFKGTILQAIMPVIGMLTVMKGAILFLESRHWWFQDPGLGELFAIIGFALGIILSQKIASTYDKFLQVEEKIIGLYGTLKSLSLILEKARPGQGYRTCTDWARAFLDSLLDSKGGNRKIEAANEQLFHIIAEVEDAPAELAILHGDICRDSFFALSKKTRLTPKPYDNLLQQATVLYLFLIAIFVPGFSGMISTIVATYILYGMYNLTQDLDTIIGGEFDLISIDISEMREFANSMLEPTVHHTY